MNVNRPLGLLSPQLEGGRMYAKILVPLDGTARSELALPVARQLAEPMGSELCLLVALDLSQVLFARDGQKLPADFELLALQQQEAADSYLADLQVALQKEGIKVATRTLTRDPRTAIVEVARKEQADLVVMTSGGKSNWMRWISGSIADHVVRGAPCPVLLVRPSMQAKEEAQDLDDAEKP